MPVLDPAARFALLALFALYFLFAFVLRSWLVYRRTGINPLVLPGSDDACGYVGRAFKVVIAACAILIQVQVRLEEQHLRGLHGQVYRDYCARVRRWL